LLDFQGTGERLDAASFLRRHWHRQPLWMPRATKLDHLPLLEPDELAWLATEDDVESRLVITDRSGEATRYRLRAGPFAAEELQALPDRDWTLLVQDVEKHLPELRAWFELIDFIPDWRIDDLMISVAAPGGSVGPHVDNYDVFLVQALGRRHWQWTAKHRPDDQDASTDLRLVQPFEGEGSHDARPGDVLYLPPGVAHHGIAEDLCVTCSVGMRAPQLSDLAALPPDAMDAFYNDADLEIDEARPGFISHSAVLRAERLLAEHGLPAENGGRALGCFATRPKEWLRPDLPESRLPLEQRLEIHGMARVAWSSGLVFANGEAHELPASAENLLAALCAARRLEPAEQRNWLHRKATRRLLEWLWKCGIFESP
jgi:50S ribosomal protein L16 3-hydroxylase